jgi:fatty acid desaturase
MIGRMSDLERRQGSRLTREQRVQRAYRLTLATGALGVVGVAGLVLAILGIIGAGLPVLALVLAAICFMLLRRTVR